MSWDAVVSLGGLSWLMLCQQGASESSDAAQVHSMMTNLAQHTDIRVALVVGGLSLNVQAATLRTSPEVVVATPVSAWPNKARESL